MTAEEVVSGGDLRGKAPPIDNLLGLLDARGQEMLVSSARVAYFAQGDVVIEQGSYVDHLYVVAEGLLRVEIPDRHGLPFEVARYTRGDYFGEMSFLRGERASATVRCLTDAQVWMMPHAVLGDLADQYPQVMREMAGLVARRLSDTNLRFRQLRPGRALACISEGTPWAVSFLLRIAESAGRHLRRPVLVVDHSGTMRTAHRGPSLPTISETLADPALLHRHDDASSSDEGVILVEQGEEIELARFIHLLSDLQVRYPLVLVHSVLGERFDQRVVDALDGPVLVHEEGNQAPEWTALSERPATQTFLLRSGDRPTLPADMEAVRAATRERVIRVIPGGHRPLEANRSLGATAEPWASVDWCARHLIRRKVGLALGAGGSKGYAHLGVVERLLELGVPIDFIAGSSIGSPIAAAVAAHWTSDELKPLLDQTFARALRPTLPIHSFLSSRTLASELQKISKGKSFEQLDIPLAIVAVDLFERCEVVFRTGEIARAMVASMAIPGIFPPVRFNGRHLVDGALLNPVPNATVAEMGADIVIGVKLTNPPGAARTQPRRRLSFRAPPIIDNIQNAFEVMQWRITTDSAARADVTIEPVFRGTTGLRDFSRGDEFVAAGRAAVDSARPAMAELIPWAAVPE